MDFFSSLYGRVRPANGRRLVPRLTRMRIDPLPMSELYDTRRMRIDLPLPVLLWL